MNKTGKHVGLDLFDTPTECIPDGADLPVFWVAPLEAGGRPLLSPPNQQHCVLTVQNCVMVEQRRLNLLFADEILYFLKRVAHWREPPILYDFLSDCLQSEVRVAVHAVAPIRRLVAALRARGDARTPLESALWRRARHSLRVMTEQPAIFALSGD